MNLDRHGEDSVVAQSRAEARPEMYGMVARTLRRASRHQPLPSPLLINAGPARLLHPGPDPVRPDRNHRRTGTQLAAAGAITVVARCSPDTPIILIDPRGRDRALLEGTGQPIAYGLEWFW